MTEPPWTWPVAFVSQQCSSTDSFRLCAKKRERNPCHSHRHQFSQLCVDRLTVVFTSGLVDFPTAVDAFLPRSTICDASTTVFCKSLTPAGHRKDVCPPHPEDRVTRPPGTTASLAVGWKTKLHPFKKKKKKKLQLPAKPSLQNASPRVK
jgi:hypothetical protein